MQNSKRPRSALSLWLSMVGAVIPLSAAQVAIAAPCAGVTQSAGQGTPIELAALAHQAGSAVRLIRTYRSGQWRVYEIQGAGDVGYIFSNGPIRPSPKAFVWGGSASPHQYGEVRATLFSGAKGLPAALATCLARELTGKKGTSR